MKLVVICVIFFASTSLAFRALMPTRIPVHTLLARPKMPVSRARSCRSAAVAASNEAEPVASMLGFVKDRAAGLALAGSLGFLGEHVAKIVPISLSPLLYATAFGIVLGNGLRLFDPEMSRMKPAQTGMIFAKKRLLRAGIILYGAKVTFAKILEIGVAGLLTDLYAVISTLALGLGLGRALGLSEGLTTLIATGSAICGCSAVAATQPIIDAEAHEVAAAVGVVVLCGTSAMFLYPFLHARVPALAASPQLMGIFTGATVHELAGVVAAGNAMGAEIASTSVVTKVGWGERASVTIPWGQTKVLRTTSVVTSRDIS